MSEGVDYGLQAFKQAKYDYINAINDGCKDPAILQQRLELEELTERARSAVAKVEEREIEQNGLIAELKSSVNSNKDFVQKYDDLVEHHKSTLQQFEERQNKINEQNKSINDDLRSKIDQFLTMQSTAAAINQSTIDSLVAANKSTVDGLNAQVNQLITIGNTAVAANRSTVDELTSKLNQAIVNCNRVVQAVEDKEKAETTTATALSSKFDGAAREFSTRIDGVESLMLDSIGLHKKIPGLGDSQSNLVLFQLDDFWSISPSSQKIAVWGPRSGVLSLDKAVDLKFARQPIAFRTAKSDCAAVAQSLRITFVKYGQDPPTDEDVERFFKGKKYPQVITAFCQTRKYNAANMAAHASNNYDPRKPLTVSHVTLLVGVAAELLRELTGDSKLDIGLGVCFPGGKYGGVRVYNLGTVKSESFQAASDIVWLCNPDAVCSVDEVGATEKQWHCNHWAATDLRGPAELVQGIPGLASADSMSLLSNGANMALRLMEEGLHNGMGQFRRPPELSSRSPSAMSGRYHHKPASNLLQEAEYGSIDAVSTANHNQELMRADIHRKFGAGTICPRQHVSQYTISPRILKAIDDVDIANANCAENEDGPTICLESAFARDNFGRLCEDSGWDDRDGPCNECVSRAPRQCALLVATDILLFKGESEGNDEDLDDVMRSRSPSTRPASPEAAPVRRRAGETDEEWRTVLYEVGEEIYVGPWTGRAQDVQNRHKLKPSAIKALNKNDQHIYRARWQKADRIGCHVTETSNKKPQKDAFDDNAHGPCRLCKSRKKQCFLMLSDDRILLKGDFDEGDFEGTPSGEEEEPMEEM